MQFSRSQWQYAVLGRDNFTCRICNSQDNLHAHSKSRLHNTLDDGITLCYKCHSLQHPELAIELFLPKKHKGYKQVNSMSKKIRELEIEFAQLFKGYKELFIAYMKLYNLQAGDDLVMAANNIITVAKKT